MKNIILFIILSIPLVIISRRTIFRINSHGFYRFLSWECMLLLFVYNYKYWFVHPFSLYQVFSWIFLLFSICLLAAGVIQLKTSGKSQPARDEKALFDFEKTSVLVDQGIFRYIRHPLYSSLLFLNWGIFLKHPAIILLFVSILSSTFLFVTALSDEKECIDYFGNAYSQYMKRTKRFIPFLF